MKKEIVFPAKFKNWDLPVTYKVARGGRGSGKSWNVARKAILYALKSLKKGDKVLCCRWIQDSLDASLYSLIKNQCDYLGVSHLMTFTQNKIVTANGCEFIFKGLFANVESIKSMENIKLCIIEEADLVTEKVFQILSPSIRGDNAQIWLVYNPMNEDDYIHTLVESNYWGDPNKDWVLVNINYDDNPWFKDNEKLDNDRKLMLTKKPVEYRHVWLGETKSIDDSALIKSEFFGYYDILPTITRGIIVGDTASSINKDSDYTVLMYAGLGIDDKIYIIDLWRGKELSNERYSIAKSFWNKHRQRKYHGLGATGLYIENASSGVDLIQRLKADNINVFPLNRTRKAGVKASKKSSAKFVRYMQVESIISSYRIMLPSNDIYYNNLHLTNASWVSDFIKECTDFRESDKLYDNDDQVDCLIDVCDLLCNNHRWYGYTV